MEIGSIEDEQGISGDEDTVKSLTSVMTDKRFGLQHHLFESSALLSSEATDPTWPGCLYVRIA